MKRPSSSFTLFLAALLFYPPWVMAQPTRDASNTSGSTLKPIEVRASTLFGLTYSIDEEVLWRDRDFEDLIFPLHDYEATRLLKRSESSGSVGGILGLVGIGGLVTGFTGILGSPSDKQTPFWVTAVGAALTFEISGFFLSEAKSTKFNAVQRYNRFALGQEHVLPQVPANEKSLLDFEPSPKAGKGPPK
jgi:hypothetical protein